MSRFAYPSKEVVREWLRHEIALHRPPPDIKQIRRELGWDLVQRNKDPESACLMRG